VGVATVYVDPIRGESLLSGVDQAVRHVGQATGLGVVGDRELVLNAMSDEVTAVCKPVARAPGTNSASTPAPSRVAVRIRSVILRIGRDTVGGEALGVIPRLRMTLEGLRQKRERFRRSGQASDRAGDRSIQAVRLAGTSALL
jgi:hypothetical protein